MSAPAKIAQGQLMPVREPAPEGKFLIKTISLPYPRIATTKTLSEQTMSTVMDELQQYGQTLCPNMEEGLRDLAQALEAMAEGRLSRRYHLSSLDPGVGKTTMMKHFIRHLLGSPQHDDVSVMVCVSRIDEVKKIIGALSDGIHNVGVLIGKDNEEDVTAALTQTDPTEARVLITTQQMIEQRCHGGRHFRDVSAFHYRSQPRQVRIWDEAFLPGQEVSLSTDNLASLIEPVRKQCNDLADGIESLRSQLRSTSTGKRLLVPSLKDLGGHAAKPALMSLAHDGSSSDNVRQAAQDFIDIAGQTLGVHQTSNGIKILLDCRDTIPQDLAPMVILDASGRCRHTYRLMEKARDNLVRLKEVRKDYSNLEINVWPCGGGKSAFARDQDQDRIRGIAQTILERPDEDWLIIHHKGEVATVLKRGLEDHLPADVLDRRVHFLHWGNHHGTNAFAHVDNVILAGTLFLPEYTYEARARLAAGMCNEDEVSRGQLRAIKEGENAHAILQGLCRAAVRGLEAGGRCKPCRAYIIASNASGIPRLLPWLFPGCQLREWKPVPEKLTGNVQRAIAQIEEAFGEFCADVMTYKELCEDLDNMDVRNFRRTVRKRESFQKALQDRDLEETEIVENGRTLKGIQRSPNPFPVEEGSDLYTIHP